MIEWHLEPQDLVRALMARDAAGRLGCGAGGGGAVMRHPFLAAVDWDALRAGPHLCAHLRQHVALQRAVSDTFSGTSSVFPAAVCARQACIHGAAG